MAAITEDAVNLTPKICHRGVTALPVTWKRMLNYPAKLRGGELFFVSGGFFIDNAQGWQRSNPFQSQ